MTMNQEQTHQESDRHVVELLTIATEYFRFLENIDSIPVEDFLLFIRKISSLLYCKGMLFPVTEEPDNTGNERFVTEEQWESIFNSIRAKLGSDDEFTYMARNEGVEEMTKGSIAEMLADVYQDMKDFALLLTKPSQLAYENGVYEIRRLFDTHWGIRLAVIMQVLHSRTLVQEEDAIDLDW